MVDDLQQLEEPSNERPTDLSTVSNIHVAESNPEEVLRQLQQLEATGHDGPMGLSTVSNVHIG